MKKLLLGMVFMGLLVSAPTFAVVEKIEIRVALVHRVKELMRKMALLFPFDIASNSEYPLSKEQLINEFCKMTCTIIKVEDEEVEYTISLCLKNDEGEFEVVSTATVSTQWGQEAVIAISESEDKETENTEDNLFIVVVAQKNGEDGAIISVDSTVANVENGVSEEVVSEQNAEVVS